MIKLIDDVNALGFMKSGAFSAKIQGFALTYGTEYDFALFYAQYVGDTPVSALSKVDGNIVLYSTDDTDFEELREFLGAVGFSTVQGDYSALKQLELNISDSSYIVKSEKRLNAEKPKNFNENPDMKKIHSLLTESGFEMGDYPAFASDVCARLNKGTARVGVIGERDCCVFRLFEGKDCVLLGAVATDKSKRGQGIASALVTYMAQGEKDAYLLTRNDSLLNFYEKLGFTPVGRWGTGGISAD